MPMSTLSSLALAFATVAALLPTHAQAPSAGEGVIAGTAAQAEAADPIVCKRMPRMGSNVPGPRECRPRSGWDNAARATRDDAERMQQMQRTPPL